MIANDLRIMKKEKDLINLGHQVIVSRES
jgi:hypothetical protein